MAGHLLDFIMRSIERKKERERIFVSRLVRGKKKERKREKKGQKIVEFAGRLDWICHVCVLAIVRVDPESRHGTLVSNVMY